MNHLFIGFPAANSRAWINTKEWNVFPNLPSGPEQDPVPSPTPDPEPGPAGHADTWYKYEGDTKWKHVNIEGQIAIIDDMGEPTGQIENPYDIVAIEIGTNVTSIGDDAFSSCNGLTSVTIGNGVMSIGVEAFSDCNNLTGMTIPDGVTSIEMVAFDGCTGLTSVTFLGKTLTQVQEMDNYPWAIPNTCIIECYDGKWIYVDGEWTNFEDYNVYYTTASNDGWHVGTAQFAAGEKAGEIIFNGFTEKFDAKRVIIPSKVSSGNDVTSIGESAFDSCGGLTSVTIPDSVTSIYRFAFYECQGLTSITIPNSVTSIGQETFYNCIKLTSVTIGNGVMSIETDAFIQCTSVTDVYCYPNPADLTWNEDDCDDFKYDGSTVCHVKSEYLSAYQAKFSGSVNVTFVGDLT